MIFEAKYHIIFGEKYDQYHIEIDNPTLCLLWPLCWRWLNPHFLNVLASKHPSYEKQNKSINLLI